MQSENVVRFNSVSMESANVKFRFPAALAQAREGLHGGRAVPLEQGDFTRAKRLGISSLGICCE